MLLPATIVNRDLLLLLLPELGLLLFALPLPPLLLLPLRQASRVCWFRNSCMAWIPCKLKSTGAGCSTLPAPPLLLLLLRLCSSCWDFSKSAAASLAHWICRHEQRSTKCAGTMVL
jgi:hypothetical protein